MFLELIHNSTFAIVLIISTIAHELTKHKIYFILTFTSSSRRKQGRINKFWGPWLIFFSGALIITTQCKSQLLQHSLGALLILVI